MKSSGFIFNIFRAAALLATATLAAHAAGPKITTVAGGFFGDGKPATSAALDNPNGIARDAKGNIYVSDVGNCRIRVVSPSGVINTMAGTGICGYSGDGGPAKAAEVSGSYGIALDRQGNLYITDGARIRKISRGTISTVAGNGTYGYSGDGGPATDASLSGPLGVFVDGPGNIYIADTGNNVIRRVDASGIIHTVAGNNIAGFSGDGGPATQASLNFPWSVIADAKGNFYISDINNDRVRKVDTSGIINTYAGNGSFGNTGSGGPATSAAIGPPVGLMLSGGNLYLSTNSQAIWTVNLATQIINLIAGTGGPLFNGDGNSALATNFAQPAGIALDGKGGVLVADSGNNRVRDIGADGIVSTIAGGNVNDGAQARNASLDFWVQFPRISFDTASNLYIADSADCRVRKVTPDGAISTIAGTGICGYSGDGGPATQAMVSSPQAVVADRNGNLFIADAGNSVIRKIDASGTITTFLTVYTYPNGAEAARAVALAIDGDGNLYASDGVSVIWKITPSGSTTIVAGVIFNLGYNGDGIPATQAWLFLPFGLAIDQAGNLYIDDWLNQRIRKVDTGGIISTVAGNGTQGFSGDGGPATAAQLSLPADVAVDAKGNIYIADWINFRVREVNRKGIIQTLAGSGGFGYNGEGLPARVANVFPVGVAVAPDGSLYMADSSDYRVRRIH